MGHARSVVGFLVVAIGLASGCGGSSSRAGDGGEGGGSGAGDGGTGNVGKGAGGAGAIGTGGTGATGGQIGLPTDPSGNGRPVQPGAPKDAYADENCTTQQYGVPSPCAQSFVCHHKCSTDASCPSAGSGSPDIVCVQAGSQTGLCLLRCGNGAICPDGMDCVITGTPEFGSACFWTTPNLQPGCPGWCAPPGDGCTRGVADDCCDGAVCAPWSLCEQGSCLQLSWPCEQGGPPCCAGTVCAGGYCKPS